MNEHTPDPLPREWLPDAVGPAHPADEALGEARPHRLTAAAEAAPAALACDLHPDYASTAYAEASGLPLARVQHHVAHVAACMAENGLSGPALGVAWDGTGYGGYGTVWCGEFRLLEGASARRVAPLRAGRRCRVQRSSRSAGLARRSSRSVPSTCTASESPSRPWPWFRRNWLRSGRERHF